MNQTSFVPFAFNQTGTRLTMELVPGRDGGRRRAAS